MTKTRTVAYLRVSTEKQADGGVSLEAQRAKVQAYAVAFDLELVAVIEDAGESAKSLDRPGLQRALAMLDTFQAEALLVVKLDRLTRNVRDLADLIDTYFKDGTHQLLSAGEHIDTRSAAGRMVLNMLTVIGQWEREAIAERTAAVMRHMKRMGRYTGGWPPFGFSLNEEGGLVPNNEEAAIVAQARALRAEGLSYRGVVAKLPLNPRTGKAFDPKQVLGMIEREIASDEG